MKVLGYKVILRPMEERKGYVIECPALEGCISEGDTKDEALKNINEAITGYIKSLIKHHEPIPEDEETEVSYVEVEV
jgi:predicted RNase H-like HicB family nuclease